MTNAQSKHLPIIHYTPAGKVLDKFVGNWRAKRGLKCDIDALMSLARLSHTRNHYGSDGKYIHPDLTYLNGAEGVVATGHSIIKGNSLFNLNHNQTINIV